MKMPKPMYFVRQSTKAWGWEENSLLNTGLRIHIMKRISCRLYGSLRSMQGVPSSSALLVLTQPSTLQGAPSIKPAFVRSTIQSLLSVSPTTPRMHLLVTPQSEWFAVTGHFSTGHFSPYVSKVPTSLPRKQPVSLMTGVYHA